MPRPVRADDLVIVLCAGAAMVLLTALTVVMTPVDGPAGRASTYSTRSDGAKAAYLTLEALGYRVARSFDRLDGLRVDPAKTTLIIASPARMPTARDTKALRALAEQGALVLITGVGEEWLPELKGAKMMGISAFDRARGQFVVYRATRHAGVLATDADAIHIAPEVTDVPAPGSTPYTTLYSGQVKATVVAGVLTMPIGRGRVIWWIGSTPLVNDDIKQPRHLELLLDTLGPPGDRDVLWSEFYHGYERGLWSYIARTPLVWALAQMAAIAAVALFTFSRRRGPVYAPPRTVRASSMEFVFAMAALYRKARAASGAVEIARTRLRRLLLASAQMPAGSDDEPLARAAASRHGLDAEALGDLLRASAAAAQAPSLAPARALAIVQRLQEAAAAVLAPSASGSSSSRARGE